MSSRDAQLKAKEAGLDLVEISAGANPPVVKIIDWGKYQYQKMKEQAKAKKKAKSSELKQIRLGLKIGENDLNIKIRKINEFLEDGDRVKVMLVFRGREMAHKEVGVDLMNKIIEKLGDQVCAIAAELGMKTVRGTIASGDRFIADAEVKKYITDNFGAIACEMEGAAVGQVCYVNKVPYLVIRAISDDADGGACEDYPAFAKKSAENSAKLVIRLAGVL